MYPIRKRINHFFIGELIRRSDPFTVAKVKLTYNFTIFYLLSAFSLGSFFQLIGNEMGNLAFILILIGCSPVFYFLRTNKLNAAIASYLVIHLFLGQLILLIKRGQFGSIDIVMGAVIINFGWYTLRRKWAILWTLFAMAEQVIAAAHMDGELSFLQEVMQDFEHPPKEATMASLMGFIMLFYMNYVFQKATNNAARLITTQKQLVAQQKAEIEQSIRYAGSIQSALIPDESKLRSVFNDCFLLYKPKDIVSGDFVWLHADSKDCIYIAVADATGHGVPGAMMSVLCAQALERSIHEFAKYEPADILNQTALILQEHLGKGEQAMKDGMDISLVRIDVTNSIFTWSGANNPLWLYRSGKLIKFVPNKQGVSASGPAQSFSQHQEVFQKNDVLYLFTDGFADQFGGPNDKKFKIRQLESILTNAPELSMDQQRLLLEKSFYEWKGAGEQTDDVCMLGFRLNPTA